MNGKTVAVGIVLVLASAITVMYALNVTVPDDIDEPPETRFVLMHDAFDITGSAEAEAMSEHETVDVTVPISIPSQNITAVEIVVKITDGDENTNPDEVASVIVLNEEIEDRLAPGSAPYSATSRYSVKEEENQQGIFLEDAWEVKMTVVCKASDDQWPGPYIWRGYPDYGFSYEILVTYWYLTPEPQPL